MNDLPVLRATNDLASLRAVKQGYWSSALCTFVDGSDNPIVSITFASRKQANEWLKDTGVRFSVLG